MEIVFLGTGAGMSVTRAHTAIAVRCGDGTLLLLDGSSGNSALRHGLVAGIRATDYDYVLLSHDHQDHISGLMFVQGRRSHETAEETPLPVFGSLLGLEGLRKAAVAARIHDIRESSPGEGKAFNHSGREVMRWREAPVGRPLELGPDTVAWPFDVDHIPGSIGWRIESGGLAVVFSGDTTYSAGLVAAAAGADLLIHEALSTDAEHDLAVSRLHSTSGDAGRAASRAAVGRLILTHLDNGFHENQAPLLEDAARHYAGPVDAAYDLYRVTLDARR